MLVESAAQWRAWLAEHAATSRGCWCVTWKNRSGRPAVAYEEVVLELLAVGCIGATARAVDAERSAVWCTSRKPGSGWSRPNKRRVALLQEQGLIRPAGQAVLHAAVADGSWTLLDDVEALLVPPDLAAALAEVPEAQATWQGFTRSATRAALEWVVLAKRPATRQSRITAVVQAAARGERAR